jgi:NDP-sugar pyrophosphorylase family protein
MQTAAGPISMFTGVHVLDTGLLDRLPRGASDSVRDLYVPALEDGRLLLGIRVRGAWDDLGSPRLYLESQLRLLRRSPRGARPVHPEARVDGRSSRSVLGAGAIVGGGARVVESVLWEGAEIGPDACVHRCIVATGARVPAGARLSGKLLVPAASGRARRSATQVLRL